MPLKFGRYYSSKLANGSGIASALGRNRLHNFDAKISVVSNDATIVLSDGRVIHFTLTNGKFTDQRIYFDNAPVEPFRRDPSSEAHAPPGRALPGPACDIETDCPHRERGAWTRDWH